MTGADQPTGRATRPRADAPVSGADQPTGRATRPRADAPVSGADQPTGPRADVPADGDAVAGYATAAGPRLTVNGDERTVAAGTTVAALVAELGLEPRGIAVAVDGEVVRRRSWDDHVLAGGEQVEVLTIAQGG